MRYDDVLALIELMGVLAFAMTGIFEARRLKMDIVGVYSLAMITAFGGGTVRDLFLQRHPLFWIQNWPYDAAILVLSFVSVLILKQIRSRKGGALVMVVTVFDALGLGLFSGLGAGYSLQVYPGNYFIAVLMGIITGCFGGVIRDIVGNKVPTVFKRSELYATCSFAGCVLYVLLAWTGIPEVVTVSLSAAVVFTIRMLAVRYDVKLPVLGRTAADPRGRIIRRSTTVADQRHADVPQPQRKRDERLNVPRVPRWPAAAPGARVTGDIGRAAAGARPRSRLSLP
jgi:uncharacterized membrane protein YeiH